MTLTLKQKAMLQTAGIIITAIAASIGIHIALAYLTSEQVFLLVGIVFIGFIVHVMYSVTLSRLEAEELVKARHKTVDQ